VKIYACRNATKSSMQSMKITKMIDTGATVRELKIKMRQIRLKITICPAVIFANNRIIRAPGFENSPIISTGIIIGESQRGTPGVAKICFQYIFVPLNCVIKNVTEARNKVTAIFPVTFAPNGKKGIKPIRLLKSIKKNTVKRYGIYLSYF
jgi:hypothetical protein